MTGAGSWATGKLGYEFSDPGLLERALTHKSRSAQNFERLEFLGDAVLGLVIAEALHQQEPEADEGDLSRMRARLVRRETLAELARGLGVGDRLLLGGGERRSGGHQRRSTMADAMEAIYGAVYLDGGYAAVRQLILTHYQPLLAALPPAEALKDPKTRLQEALQARGIGLPDYRAVSESGPAHQREFVMRCVVGELKIDTRGTGGSRRDAEQQAAADALEQLQRGADRAS